MVNKKYAIGVDLGGTNLKIGLVDESGNISEKKHVPVSGDRTALGIVKAIAKEANELKKKISGDLVGMGCGIPGIVDFESGFVRRSPNYPDWENASMRDEIIKLAGIPVVVDNDANMYALGEAKFGAGRGHKNMILLTLGTGIGGGLILDGKIFHGDEGFAGEAGHIVVDPNGIKCGCGGRGCLEQYAASRAFKVFADRLSNNDREDFLKKAKVSKDNLTPEIVARLADEKDRAAIEMWNEFGKYLGVGIATLINVLGVETFVIGGGIAKAWDKFINSARESALLHTYKYHKDKLTLKPAKLGSDAGIIGAASEAFAQME